MICQCRSDILAALPAPRGLGAVDVHGRVRGGVGAGHDRVVRDSLPDRDGQLVAGHCYTRKIAHTLSMTEGSAAL
jgi:hypothetical protein